MLGNLAIAPARYFSYSSAFARGVFPVQARAITVVPRRARTMTAFPGRPPIAAIPRESPALGSAQKPTSATATDTAATTAFMRVTSDGHGTPRRPALHRIGQGRTHTPLAPPLPSQS